MSVAMLPFLSLGDGMYLCDPPAYVREDKSREQGFVWELRERLGENATYFSDGKMVVILGEAALVEYRIRWEGS